MLIVMSLNPILTDELLKVNSALKPVFFVIEDSKISLVGDNEGGNAEDSTSKQGHVK